MVWAAPDDENVGEIPVAIPLLHEIGQSVVSECPRPLCNASQFCPLTRWQAADCL